MYYTEEIYLSMCLERESLQQKQKREPLLGRHFYIYSLYRSSLLIILCHILIVNRTVFTSLSVRDSRICCGEYLNYILLEIYIISAINSGNQSMQCANVVSVCSIFLILFCLGVMIISTDRTMVILLSKNSFYLKFSCYLVNTCN